MSDAQPDPHRQGYAAALDAVRSCRTHPPHHSCDVCNAVIALASEWAHQAAYHTASTGPGKVGHEQATAIADSICLKGYPIDDAINDHDFGKAFALAVRIANGRAYRINQRHITTDWSPKDACAEQRRIGGWILTVSPIHDGISWKWKADFPNGETNDGTPYSGARFEGEELTKSEAKATALETARRTMLG